LTCSRRPHCPLPTTDCQLPTADCRLPTADCRLPTADCRLPTADCRLIMHVCFFNRSYWPDLSATGQLLTELAEDLVSAHGWDVTVVCGYPLRSEARLAASEWRHGVHINRAAGSTVDPGAFVGRATNYITYFASATLKGLRLRKADVVVALTDPPI